MNVIGIALAVVLGALGLRWLSTQRPKRRERAQIKALMVRSVTAIRTWSNA